MRFADKVVIVTGAASGIGLATSQRFAAEGAIVALVDRFIQGASLLMNGGHLSQL